MHFEPFHIYHLYNLGNNHQPIFYNNRNYEFFLKKVKTEWLPFTNIISYSLLPTQFHFIIMPNEYGCMHLNIQEKISPLQKLSSKIGHTLSAYTKAVNKSKNRMGCLFHKKTKTAELNNSLTATVDFDDLIYRIKQLHYKPVLNGLADLPTEWKFSSAREYAGEIKGFCSRRFALSSSMHEISEIQKQSTLLVTA